MKVVLLTIVVTAVLYFLVQLLAAIMGIENALILVGCACIAYYLAKDE